MGNWGISPNASEKEKIKAEWADELNGKNSTGNIDYDTYSELFDVGMDLLDRMYKLGKSDGEERKTGHWEEFEFEYGNGEYVGHNCSECSSPHFEIRNYCPNCGAKMEAVNDGK
ncbi:MAG: hypothetical protein IJN28_05310 [Selenomonadales bacterium]|nr:hypothetical protein [Selenomonadales bacterium]